MPLAFPPFGTQLTAPGALTIAASTWRWDGVSGPVLVSSACWLQPGAVSAANLNQFRVFVGGVEQAVALTPLDGPFPDGSYRSVGIQYTYNLTNDTPVPAEIRINQGVRGTVDVAWINPTRAMMLKKAVIAPTDPAYMCGTFVTLTPLTPATNDTGLNAAWAAVLESSWLTNPAVHTGSNFGTANYDIVTGCLNTYCRTGTRVWYQYAYDWATGFHGETGIDVAADSITLIEGLLPNTAAGSTCASAATWNPEGLVHVIGGGPDCGSPNEANRFGKWLSLAVAYWFTGYRQFKRLLALNANYSLYGTAISYPTFRDKCVGPWYGQRYNLGFILCGPLYGYLTGCTTGMVHPAGLPAVTTFDYATYLPWMLNALGDYIWNLPGDYRNGLVGQRHETISVPDQPGHPGSGDHYGVTNFQLALMAEWLIVYYEHVTPDSRIPGWIQTLCDYFILQSRASISTATGTESGYPNTYVTAYDNIPPAAVAASSFQATIGIGNPNLTWTAGPMPAEYPTGGLELWGPGIPPGAQVLTGVYPGSGGTVITMTANCTAAGSITVKVPMATWYLPMMATAFAWLSAYTGTAIYNTWVDRCMVPGAVTNAQTKNWGENYGGTRQGVLYYRHGGTVRGTPGVHPTVITNPPAQPLLG